MKALVLQCVSLPHFSSMVHLCNFLIIVAALQMQDAAEARTGVLSCMLN